MQLPTQPEAAGAASIVPEYERKQQFARRVSVSVRTVDNWIRDRRIPYLKVGRSVLIPWRDAMEELKRRYCLRAGAVERGGR